MYIEEALMEQSAPDNTKTEGMTTFKTRFGEVSYNPQKTLSFADGVLGMPGQKEFFIAAMPVEKLAKFQVMQSLVEDDVSFAVLPLEVLGEKIEDKDLADIKQKLKANDQNLLIILITSIHRTPSGTKLSVNLRAPVFINTDTREAAQVVLPNSKYEVQHYLN